MVGGDHVDGALPQAGNNGMYVLSGAQGRIDPGQRPLGEHLVLGERKVLGTGLAGDSDPFFLHLPDNFHASGGGHMADMDAGPRLLGQHGVPHHHNLLRDGRPPLQPELAGNAALVYRPAGHHRRILAVAQHGHLQLPGPDEHIPHQVGVVHVVSVVRQGDGPCLLKGLGVGGLLPQQPLGQGGDGIDPHSVGLSPPVQHIFHLLRAVHRRAGVGHAGHRGDAPPGGGGAAGEDVLLVGQPRVPEMDVHIHQPRGHRQSGGVDGAVSLHGHAPLQHADPAVFRQNVLEQHRPRHRMDHPSVFD